MIIMSLEYGLIGNCRTSALVFKDSSIDWLCFPRFDSPSIFAKILDEKKGGFFKIIPVGNYKIKQNYIYKTNVLKTIFSNDKNKFEVIDYFPYYKENNKLKKESELHRILIVKKGKPKIKIIFDPKLDYARGKTKISIDRDKISAKKGNETIFLYSNLSLDKILKQKIIELKDVSFLILTYNKLKEKILLEEIKNEMKKTIEYWRSWVNKATLPDKFKDEVMRSALTLRLLTYDESGGIIAAPTTSIPEIIGKERNWDYRYCWIRDASFTIMALSRICEFDVARDFMKWLSSICIACGINLQIVYGVNGERNLEEKKLKHLSGYKNSKPVRIGNAAYKQRQMDIFGEFLDAVYLFYVRYKYVSTLTQEQWDLIYSLVEAVINEWKKPDHSIWEFRTINKHFTFSKVLSWVALDRGIKIAEYFDKRNVIKRWSKVRDEIKKDVLKKGWNKKLQSFTQSYGSEELDASLLLMPYFDFISYNDERMKKTVYAIQKKLFKNGFLLRYSGKDDFGYQKNAFLPCSFWLVDALYKMGKKKQAMELFQKIIKYANHLKLLSEDVDPETGELTGNFPQALSHIALINSATLFSLRGTKGPVCMPSL